MAFQLQIKKWFHCLKCTVIILSKFRCSDNNLTVIACTQSDYNVLNDNNGDLRDLFKIEDMLKIFNVLGKGGVF